MDDKNKNPETEPTGNDIESPIDGPMPDWMRLATSTSSSGSSLTEENTPAWLKSIRAGQSVSNESTPTQPTEPAPTTPAGDDSMSDLERLLAEEGIDLGGVAEERPEGSSGMSARDWLIATSSEEIIRNKVGAQPQAEEPPPPSAPVIAQTNNDSMSDLERLLAEEGIDLGGVAEERPEGSSGMSARDWLIATSSEEIIRNKVGAQPQAEEPPVVASVPAPNDDKMVVAEDLPDWLQDIADDTTEAAPVFADTPAVAGEGNLFAGSEDLPDWLQDIADETPSDFTVAEVTTASPVGQAASFAADEDKMVVREDLPDWLQDIADDEAASGSEIPSADFSALRPSPAAFSTHTEDKMVVAEDLPDWLQDIADEPVAEQLIPEQARPTFSNEAKIEGEEDLPDWLQDIAAKPMVSLEAEPDLPPLEILAQSPVTTDKMVVEEDLPDWLREAAAEEKDLPSSLPPADSDPDKLIVMDDLPDWLREVETANEEADTILPPTELETVVSDLDDSENDEDLPDWLREVEVSSLEDSITTPPVKSTDAPPEPLPTPVTSLAEDEFDLLDDKDLPGWLKEVQEHNGREPVETLPQTASAELDLPNVSSDEDELPDWLREAQEEDAPLEFTATPPVTTALTADNDQPVADEDLPDWLRETQFDVDEPFEPSEPSPEPLELATDDLPDWLQEVEDEVPEGVILPVEEIVPALPSTQPSPSADGMVDEEGLPDWLREEMAEEIETSAVAEPLSVSEPIVAEVVEETIIEELLIEEVVTPEEIISVAPAEPEPAAISETVVPPVSTGSTPDWLQKLREGDQEEPIFLPTPPVVAPVMIATAKPTLQPSYAQAVAPPLDIPADAEARLKQARLARDKGNLDEALQVYDSLVVNGVYLDKIIEDMQQIIKTNPNNYLLFQLMGDAMMRDGRLQSALTAYREALSRL